jgi:thiosulfate/3-mercaptopyruvate sulfurtransferase
LAHDHDPDALVSTAWLAAHLGDSVLRVFECTTHLRPAAPDEGVPYHPEAGRAAYDDGHIEGAGFLDLPGELSDPEGATPLTMPTPERFAEVMSRHGVGDGTRVVLYSRTRVMWATRVWWMLRVMGFETASVLDGGLAKWVAEGRPTTTEPARYPRAAFVARPRPELLVDRHRVLAAIDDPAVLLINTLTEDDFRGLKPSRYGRPGRIPGSRNLPWPGLSDPADETMIPLEAAARALEPLGAPAAEQIVCYCGGGISATEALFQLHRLGYANLALYDGSMSEWARAPELPIERDPPESSAAG